MGRRKQEEEEEEEEEENLVPVANVGFRKVGTNGRELEHSAGDLSFTSDRRSMVQGISQQDNL